MEWRIGAKIPEISATLRPAKASVARGRGPLRQPVLRTGRVRPDRADDSKAWWMLRLGLFPRRPDYPHAAHSHTALPSSGARGHFVPVGAVPVCTSAGPGLPTHPARPSRVPDPRRLRFGPQGCSRSVRIARVSSRAPNVFTAVILNSLCDNPTSVPHLPDPEAGFCFPRLSVLCDSLLKAGHDWVTDTGANWLFVGGFRAARGRPECARGPRCSSSLFCLPSDCEVP